MAVRDPIHALHCQCSHSLVYHATISGRPCELADCPCRRFVQAPKVKR